MFTLSFSLLEISVGVEMSTLRANFEKYYIFLI